MRLALFTTFLLVGPFRSEAAAGRLEQAEEKTDYEQRVRVTVVSNPPADASRRRHQLLSVVRRTAPSSSGGAAVLEGPVWRLRRLGDRDVSAGKGVTARFYQGRVAGVSACNQYSGAYARDRGRLVLEPLAGTMMACPDPAMTLEQAFRGAFSGTVGYEVAGGRLVISADSGVTLEFEVEPEDALDGTPWTVTGYNNGRQAVVSVVSGTTIALAFRDGTLTGHSGCNNFKATYTVNGNGLTVGPVAATRKACPEAEVMAQEQAFLAALGMARTWRAQDGVLELRTETGALAVTARAKAAEEPRD